MSARQQYDTIDRLLLEVQQPWPNLPNLVPNPTGTVTVQGWTAFNGTEVTATSTGLRIARTGAGTDYALVWGPLLAVPPGKYVRAIATRVSGAATRQVGLEVLAMQTPDAYTTGPPASAYTATDGATVTIPTFGLGADVNYLRPLLYVPALTIGQAVTVTDVVLVYSDEADVDAATMTVEKPWQAITGSVRELTIERDELQVGVTTASLVGADLDPATVNLLRPGRGLRAAAYVDGEWERLTSGTILTAKTGYDLKTKGIPDAKRSRIVVTAVDELSRLANTPRPSGVATLDELAYVLDGTGVPWNVNGNTGPIDPDTVTVVSTVEAASAVDQVAITRDTVRGYAWLDRHGVLQAWDAAELDATVVDVLDEATYSEASVDFDSERCINTVTVKQLAVDVDGATQENSYGPYVDSDSVREWGPRSAEFTVHGLDVEDLDDYAAGILAAAATPAEKVNEVTLPLRTTAELEAHVLRDLYDLVTVQNDRADFDQDLRVVSVKHRITSGPTSGACRWFVDLGFAADESVAPPQVTPSPTQPTAETLAGRLRPVGEVTMWYGAAVDCPVGWLICDGTPFSGPSYPKLEDHLGGTALPNMVDRVPVGAGVKALGATGGADTIATTHLPATTVRWASDAAATGGGTRVVNVGGTTGNNTGSSDTFGGGQKFEPKHLALHFIIRAR